VILDAQGNIYGTTSYGGVEGMIYKVDPSRQEATLYNFQGAPGGTKPDAGVTMDSAGNLYGATQDGGATELGRTVQGGYGWARERTVTPSPAGPTAPPLKSHPWLTRRGTYTERRRAAAQVSPARASAWSIKVDTSGQETVLHTFTGGTDGGYPNWLIRDPVGNLYAPPCTARPAGALCSRSTRRDGSERLPHGKPPSAGEAKSPTPRWYPSRWGRRLECMLQGDAYVVRGATFELSRE
jgi:hypothetical protein